MGQERFSLKHVFPTPCINKGSHRGRRYIFVPLSIPQHKKNITEVSEKPLLRVTARLKIGIYKRNDRNPFLHNSGLQLPPSWSKGSQGRQRLMTAISYNNPYHLLFSAKQIGNPLSLTSKTY